MVLGLNISFVFCGIAAHKISTGEKKITAFFIEHIGKNLCLVSNAYLILKE